MAAIIPDAQGAAYWHIHGLNTTQRPTNITAP
jgi:hypothetical protein